MTPAKYDEYMARAFLAEYVDARLFAHVPAPQDPRDNNERNETEQPK